MANGGAVKQSRPKLELAGQENASLAGGLLSLRIEERLDGLASLEASFGNWGPTGGETGFLYFDRALLDFGKELKVSLGGDVLFNGRITALEGVYPEGSSPVVTVLAEDRLQDLRMTRRTRTFADSSDSDVINQIASDHGLSADVSLSGPTHKVLAQLNQSDLAFMRERARANDAEVWVDGSQLKVKQHASRNGGTLELTYGRDLRDFTVLADLADQRTSVDVTGWDVAGKQALTESAEASAISGELSGGKSGASVLQSALGDRKETVSHAAPFTSGEAHARAEAIFKRRSRRFLTGRGVAETNGKLKVGTSLTLKALGPLFNGDYFITEVHHLFDGTSGLRTEFGVERPGLGGGPS
jgi:phage protein D